MSGAIGVTILLAAALALSWRWRPQHPPEGAARALLILYGLLGGWALWFGLFAQAGKEPEIIVLFKPTILYWSLALLSVAAPALRWGYPAKAVIGTYFVFTNPEWRWINRGFAAFLVVLGGLNVYIALTATRGEWEGFKWSCMVNVIAVVLLRVTFLWIDTIVRTAVHLRALRKTQSP